MSLVNIYLMQTLPKTNTNEFVLFSVLRKLLSILVYPRGVGNITDGTVTLHETGNPDRKWTQTMNNTDVADFPGVRINHNHM